SSAATTGSTLVRRNTRRPLRADSAASGSPDSWATKVDRSPTRPGFTKSSTAHRSPSPFSMGVPVSASRLPADRRRSCWAVSLAGFLMAWASSTTLPPPPSPDRAPAVAGRGCAVAPRGAEGGDDRVGPGPLLLEVVGRRPGGAVVDDHPQARREPGRLGRPVADDRRRGDDQRGPGLGGAGHV